MKQPGGFGQYLFVKLPVIFQNYHIQTPNHCLCVYESWYLALSRFIILVIINPRGSLKILITACQSYLVMNIKYDHLNLKQQPWLCMLLVLKRSAALLLKTYCYKQYEIFLSSNEGTQLASLSRFCIYIGNFG